MSKKLPPLSAVGTKCPLNGYVAVLATAVIDHHSIPAYLRTEVSELGSRYTYIHSMERDRKVIEIELVDGTHHRCGEHMTVFVPEDAAIQAGIWQKSAA